MNEKPLITVIIPSYNSPDIYATLNSVLKQDYPRIQLILIDDGSDEFNQKEIETYLENHSKDNFEEIKIIVNPENRGTVYTMNVGLNYSRGKYIFNLASDDCFYDDKVLTDWVDAFVHTGANVMTAYRAVYDEKLQRHIKTEPQKTQVEKIKGLSPKELFEDLSCTNYIFGCCTARTIESVQKYGAFDEDYRLIEDHPMNLRLLRMGEPIFFYDRVVVKYRGGGTSSPIKYNKAYEIDVDTVLNKDVLPYTKRPLYMKWRYYLWKRDQSLLRRTTKLIINYEGKKIAKAGILLWYYIHHPVRVVCGILRRCKRM